MAKPVILCVDDEKTVLTSLKHELEFGLGGAYAFEIAESGEEGLEVLQELMDMGIEVPVIISDQLMPGMKGDQFLIEANHLITVSRKILLTGQASADAVGNAVNHANLYRYIAKPWEEEDLRLTVEEAAKSFFLNQSLETKIRTLENLNQHADRLAQKVEPTDLIQTFLAHTLRDLGATKGGFLLFPEQGDPWWIVLDPDDPTQMEQIGMGELPAGALPMEIVEATHGFPHPLNLPVAFKKGNFTEVPYVKDRKTRSVFCAPLRTSSRMIAVLYLEHQGKYRYFGPEKSQFLSQLLQQACPAFENALLYHSLEQKILDRTATIRLINQEMEHSIHYASRLQQAFLPGKDRLKELFTAAFVLFQPKDIVSGDFYWVEQVGDKIVVAAVDCTGHGVPGAIMTVLGYSSLNSIVLDQEILDPAEILTHLDKRVRFVLNQDHQDSVQQDGMDMALCVVDLAAQKLVFSGAMNPLLRIRNGEIEEWKGDKLPIGGVGDKQFTTHTLDLQPGDQFFMYSDGYLDQFGGPGERKKRFGSRRLKNLLLASASQPMEEIQEILTKEFDQHQGTEERLDDVLVMGIKI